MEIPEGARLSIPYPPSELFSAQRKSAAHEVTKEPITTFILDRVEYPPEGGIYVYNQGLLYPTKGFPTPESVAACNVAKRILAVQVKFLMTTPLVLIATALNPIKNIKKFLDGYINSVWFVLKPYIYLDRYYSNPCKEIRTFVEVFMSEVGLNQFAAPIATILATLIEYDTAYRYRLEDILSETTPEKLRNDPKRELDRLVGIFCERNENKKLSNKITNFVKLARYVLYFPRAKKAFKKALSSINFANLQLDDADTYHVLTFRGYDFMGLPWQFRVAQYIQLHNGNPPQGYVIHS